MLTPSFQDVIVLLSSILFPDWKVLGIWALGRPDRDFSPGYVICEHHGLIIMMFMLLQHGLC